VLMVLRGSLNSKNGKNKKISKNSSWFIESDGVESFQIWVHLIFVSRFRSYKKKKKKKWAGPLRPMKPKLLGPATLVTLVKHPNRRRLWPTLPLPPPQLRSARPPSQLVVRAAAGGIPRGSYGKPPRGRIRLLPLGRDGLPRRSSGIPRRGRQYTAGRFFSFICVALGFRYHLHSHRICVRI
jgi:hypothetical protein